MRVSLKDGSAQADRQQVDTDRFSDYTSDVIHSDCACDTNAVDDEGRA